MVANDSLLLGHAGYVSACPKIRQRESLYLSPLPWHILLNKDKAVIFFFCFAEIGPEPLSPQLVSPHCEIVGTHTLSTCPIRRGFLLI